LFPALKKRISGQGGGESGREEDAFPNGVESKDQHWLPSSRRGGRKPTGDEKTEKREMVASPPKEGIVAILSQR